MSSEISTDQRPPSSFAASDPAPRDSSFHPWQLFTLAGLLTASAVAFQAGRQPSSVRIALILTVFAAAAIGMAALRTLSPLAGGVSRFLPQVVGGRTRAALEREKSLVLRSIKELEFDRAMRKVSERDFAEMGARLRARAAGIIHQLDAGASYRDAIERDLQARGAASRGGVGTTAIDASAPAAVVTVVAATPDAAVLAIDEGRAASTVSPGACSACHTDNDLDARFCKGCGARLQTA